MPQPRRPIRKLVVVSDLHCGSTVGLLPRDAKTLEGNRIKPNNVQAWLADRWDEAMRFVADSVGSDPYGVVVVGDVTEGNHHGGKQTVGDAHDHYAWALDMLMPLCKPAKATYIVMGTECHTREGEHMMADVLKATPDEHNDKPAWDELDLSVNGYRMRFVHHIATTSREHLAAGRLSIALTNMQSSASRAKHPVPSALICGHCHRFDEYHTATGDLCLTLPAWQFLTRYGHKVVPSARTHVGLVLLDFPGPANTPPRVSKYIRFATPNKGAEH